MSLNKCGCDIANVGHTAIMLNGHIDPIFLQVSTKRQPTATVTSHIIAKYVPKLNMPSNAIDMAHMQISSCAYMR